MASIGNCYISCFFRRQPDELHRLLNFANRDLSVLTCSNQTDVLKIFDILLELLLEVNMKSVEFSATLAAYLGQRTNHFVHELINFARSPYNDLISYECNVKYRARQPEPEDNQVPLLQGLHCFMDFTMRVDEDECVDFLVDLDLEDDDAEMIDESSNLVELNAPLILELRRLNERQAAQSAQQMQQPQQQQQQQRRRTTAVAAASGAGTAAGTVASPVNGNTTSTAGLTPGMPSSDIGLDVAIARSIQEGIDSGYFTQRRNTSIARQIVNRNRDAAVAAAAATAVAAASGGAAGGVRGTVAGVGAAAGVRAAAAGVGAAAAGVRGAATGVRGAAAASNASIRGTMTARPRSASVVVKRRRTVIREI